MLEPTTWLALTGRTAWWARNASRAAGLMYRITRSRSQYIMFVGALSTMARETASNAKATSEPLVPSARAEADVWLLMPLIAAGDLRP